jgi:hypothetical protein
MDAQGFSTIEKLAVGKGFSELHFLGFAQMSAARCQGRSFGLKNRHL